MPLAVLLFVLTPTGAQYLWIFKARYIFSSGCAQALAAVRPDSAYQILCCDNLSSTLTREGATRICSPGEAALSA
jgi:hypothetical protein